jgi:hypothetical protein
VADDELYEGLSSDEIKTVQRLTQWSSAAIREEHRALIRLVSKGRKNAEAFLDRHGTDDDWIPPMEFTAFMRTIIDGGAKLIESWYKDQRKNPAMGLTDEQLEIELNKAALALFEQIPLDEAERSIRRRKYIETRGEERPPKGERFAQNAHLLNKGAK